MNAKVSIIIPVYNVKKYLPRCLDSIVNQTYRDLEIICVNDGSNDGSIEVLNEYLNKDARFKVIDKENGGPSSARNAGLKAATSNYVMFVDSDDEIHTDMIEVLMKQMQDNKADISMCDTVEVYEYDKLNKEQYFNEKENIVALDDNTNIMKSFFEFGIVNISPCAKLFKKEVLNGIYFNEDITNNEDRLFLYFVYLRANKVVHTNKKMYYYIKRNNSLSNNNNKFHNKFLDILKVSQIIEKHVKENNIGHLKFCEYHNYLSTLNLYRMLVKSSNKREFKLKGKDMRKYLINNYKVVKGKLQIKRKFEILLIKWVPFLFDILWNFKAKNF